MILLRDFLYSNPGKGTKRNFLKYNHSLFLFLVPITSMIGLLTDYCLLCSTLTDKYSMKRFCKTKFRKWDVTKEFTRNKEVIFIFPGRYKRPSCVEHTNSYHVMTDLACNIHTPYIAFGVSSNSLSYFHVTPLRKNYLFISCLILILVDWY